MNEWFYRHCYNHPFTRESFITHYTKNLKRLLQNIWKILIKLWPLCHMHSVVRRDAKTATTRRCVTRPCEIHTDSESDTCQARFHLLYGGLFGVYFLLKIFSIFLEFPSVFRFNEHLFQEQFISSLHLYPSYISARGIVVAVVFFRVQFLVMYTSSLRADHF